MQFYRDDERIPNRKPDRKRRVIELSGPVEVISISGAITINAKPYKAEVVAARDALYGFTAAARKADVWDVAEEIFENDSADFLESGLKFAIEVHEQIQWIKKNTKKNRR